MNRLLPVFCAAFGLVLAGCSDADWENAMSFLPMERGAQAQQAMTGAPPARNVDVSTTMSATDNTSAAAPTMMAPAVPVAAASPSGAAIRHCQSIAAQRSADGAYMGMDEDAQKQEYDLTYADCMKWEAAHGG